MVIARRKRRVCGGVHRGASSLRWASRTLRSHPLREKEVRLPLAHRFRSARISSRHAPWHGELARGISASRSPPSRPLESPRGRGVAPRTEGVKRRLALVRNAAPPWPALRSGRSLHREGPPVHHADRRAFRRFTAAILGFGTGGRTGGISPALIPEALASVHPALVQPGKGQSHVVGTDGGPEASRGSACEAHPRAPPLAPPSERLRKAPSVSEVRGI
jgi:hypothetical protein